MSGWYLIKINRDIVNASLKLLDLSFMLASGLIVPSFCWALQDLVFSCASTLIVVKRKKSLAAHFRAKFHKAHNLSEWI
jgi:hypothetical protein